jgi:hypothetical protein
MDQYRPTAEGAGFEFTPILKPLETVKDSLIVVSNLDRPGDDDSHATASAAWLSGAIAKKTEGQDFHLGTTIDQVIAKQIGQDTPFPSIEVATEDFAGYVGGCSPAYACAYMNTISWAPRPRRCRWKSTREWSLERLFGRPGTGAQRAAHRRQDASVLDSIKADPRGSRAQLRVERSGPARRYSDNIREIERRIQRTEDRNNAEVTPPRCADRRPAELRRALPDALRPPDGRLPGRPHARRDVWRWLVKRA